MFCFRPADDMLPFSTNVMEDDHSHAAHCHNHHCCCCARHSVSSNSFVTYLAQAKINIHIQNGFLKAQSPSISIIH